jgi:hypothetical protein
VSKRKPVPVRERALYGVLATAVVLGILISPLVVWHARQPRTPVHFKVDREIASDIRIGADKQQVIEYCARRGWKYSVRSEQAGEKILATDRAAPGLQLLRSDVLITFEFDRAGKLTAFHSEDANTGP